MKYLEQLIQKLASSQTTSNMKATLAETDLWCSLSPYLRKKNCGLYVAKRDSDRADSFSVMPYHLSCCHSGDTQSRCITFYMTNQI